MSIRAQNWEGRVYFEEFEHVEAHVHVGEARVEGLEVDIMDILRDEAGDLGGWVSDDIEQGDDVRSACQVLKDLDFTLDFLLLHRLQDLDDALLLCRNVDALKNLGKSNKSQDRSDHEEYTPRSTFPSPLCEQSHSDLGIPTEPGGCLTGGMVRGLRRKETRAAHHIRAMKGLAER